VNGVPQLSPQFHCLSLAHLRSSYARYGLEHLAFVNSIADQDRTSCEQYDLHGAALEYTELLGRVKGQSRTDGACPVSWSGSGDYWWGPRKVSRSRRVVTRVLSHELL
jgi:hypothetical protein